MESRIWSKVVEGLDHPYLHVDSPHRKGSIESRKELSLKDYVTHMKRQVDAVGDSEFYYCGAFAWGSFCS